MANTLKEHWETVCKNKQPYEVSWTEEISTIPISLINDCKLPLTAHILDVGGGDSKLVDHLLEEGF